MAVTYPNVLTVELECFEPIKLDVGGYIGLRCERIPKELEVDGLELDLLLLIHHLLDPLASHIALLIV